MRKQFSRSDVLHIAVGAFALGIIATLWLVSYLR